MDGRARFAPWEGNRDLPIVPDAWLLPLPAVERAGSSKNHKDRQLLGVRADKRAHGACCKASLEVEQSQGVQEAMQCDQWLALCPLSCSPSTCLCLPIWVMLWSGAWLFFHFSPAWKWN